MSKVQLSEAAKPPIVVYQLRKERFSDLEIGKLVHLLETEEQYRPQSIRLIQTRVGKKQEKLQEEFLKAEFHFSFRSFGTQKDWLWDELSFAMNWECLWQRCYFLLGLSCVPLQRTAKTGDVYGFFCGQRRKNPIGMGRGQLMRMDRSLFSAEETNSLNLYEEFDWGYQGDVLEGDGSAADQLNK